MALDLSVGQRGGQWSGRGNVGVEEVHGDLSGGTEVRVAIKNKVQVGWFGRTCG